MPPNQNIIKISSSYRSEIPMVAKFWTLTLHEVLSKILCSGNVQAITKERMLVRIIYHILKFEVFVLHYV